MHSEQLLEAMDGVALVVGSDQKIRNVGWRNWNAFWLRNGGDGQLDLAGREITDFFSAGEVRDTFRRLFADVLADRRPRLRLDYRCDSPSTRRQMRLAVTPIRAPTGIAALLYQSTYISFAHRAAVPLAAAEIAEEGDCAALKMCVICARVAWPADPHPASQVWIEPQDYYRGGGQDVARVAHGFCRPCYRRLELEFD